MPYSDYSSLGHDDIESLLDEETLTGQDDISMFFGGSGDLRHFYGTIMALAKSEVSSNIQNRRYHFTLNDTKPGTFARAMVFFYLLDELATSAGVSMLGWLERLAVIFYVFVAPVIPRVVFDRLHQVLDSLIEAMETQRVVLPWVRVHPRDKSPILLALKSWKSKDLLDFISPDGLAAVVMPKLDQLRMTYGADRLAPSGCMSEFKLYFNTLILLVPVPLFQRHDAALLEHLRCNIVSIPTLKNHVKENWAVNTTILDEEWHLKADAGIHATFNPFELVDQFNASYSGTAVGTEIVLFDYLGPFFDNVSRAIRRLRGRMSVELIVGDAITAMETVRYNLTEDRIMGAPTTFDCVHLYNVPDYIGGSFVNFIYGTKILKKPVTSILTSKCLRNIGVWQSIDHFHSEYMLASNTVDIFKLTQVQNVQRNALVEFPPEMPFAPSMIGYKTWCRATMCSLEYEVLLPRAAMDHWLFAHFFKMVHPVAYNLTETPLATMVISPLNLTHFFCLLMHLCEVGYPVHWLADVLRRILDNRIVTTARPPRTRPLLPEEAAQVYPAARFSAAPYLAEMSTLTVIFERMLPFYPITDSSLPALRSVYLYNVTIPMETPVEYANIPTLVLILFRMDLHMLLRASLDFIPSILYPKPENPTIDPRLRQFREEGCIMITTFEWTGYDIDDQSASFWMREDVIQRIVRDVDAEWMCALWSTLTWLPISIPTSVSYITQGRRWTV